MNFYYRIAFTSCLLGIMGVATALSFPSVAYAQECTVDGKAGHYEDPYWDGTSAPPEKVCVPDGSSIDATGVVTKKTPGLEACQDSGLIGGNFSCALAWTVIGLFSGLISLIVAVMLFVEGAFDAAIQYTVVDFGRWFSYVEQPVQLIWTMARDIGNIFIIGIFVFIAISIILGMQEYGQKKLIARVIIVSVLINFSFLFTIIVINTSNLFASRLYELAAAGTKERTDSSQIVGIGNAFVNYLGVKTSLDTSQQLIKLYNQKAPGETTGSYVAIFKHAFFIFIFFTATSVVFFYGAFLLFGRFVVLILLLMVSAAVFALYLMPSLSESVWGRWKNALIQNSFLAPIMFFFLWASMQVAKTLADNGIIGAKAGQAASFGVFASDQLSASAWQAAFGMILMLGLLGLGMYISNQIASGLAQRIAMGGAALGIGIPSRLVGAGGRWFIGGRAAASAHTLDEKMKSNVKTMATLDLDNPEQAKKFNKLRNEWLTMNRQKGRRESLAKSSFEMMDTKAGQKLATAGGLGAVFKKTGASYEHTAHEQDEKVVKEAIKAAIGDKDAAKLARQENGATERDDRTTGERELQAAQNNLKAAEANANAIKEARGLTTQLKDAQDTVSDATQRQLSLSKEPPSAAREAAMRAEDARIKAAQGIIGSTTRAMKDIDTAHTASARNILKKAQDSHSLEKETIRSRTSTIQSNSSKAAQGIGVARSGGLITRSLRAATGIDLDSAQSHHVAEAVKGRTRGNLMDKAKERKDLRTASGEGGGAPAHPPAASGGGDSHGAAPAH